jgi:glycerophosphoryl diester phosphodiesterase
MAAAQPPILIAHRGASGYLPEHTLAAYALAILQGADYIEPDLVATQDGVLVARHENEIGGTTNVAAHPEFAARRRTQHVDGVAVSGWFTEDFTLAELKTLRARERIPELRPGNAQYDGRLEVPTFAEILVLLTQVNTTRTQAGLAPVGIYPETKHPSHFAALGLALEPPLLASLHKGLGSAPVFIQCFEVNNLRQLRRNCGYPLVQLMSAAGGPWDLAAEGATYTGMCTPDGLRRVAEYAQAIGVQKEMVLAQQAGLPQPTPLVADAHAAGLAVHVWTFRAENHFLPAGLHNGGGGPAGHGDLAAEVRAHLLAGIDGLFCDFPALARPVMEQFAADAVTASSKA